MTQKQNQDPGIVVLLACILDDNVDDEGDDVADTEEDVHDAEIEPGAAVVCT